MKKNPLGKCPLIQKIFKDNSYCWLAFACTAGLMLLVYYCHNMFPFGDTTILRMDLYHQYGPLFAELFDRITKAKSLIYSWNTGLGSPFLGNFFNYLSSPTAVFMLLFGHNNMPEAIAAMVLTKAAFASASFTLYLKKSLGRHDFTTAAFGVLYSMCGFFVAYYWNVMWIDAMVYFPLVIYGIERIINRRKPSVYIAFLALTLISNYYMGYMTCIFSVIYFIVYFLSNYEFSSLAPNTVYYYDTDHNKKVKPMEKLKGSIFLRSGLTFAAGSAAAGCLVAFSLIPTYLILKSCSATSGTWPTEYRTYFSAFDFLANHITSVDPTIRSSGDDVLPNVYCGMAVLLLVPLYLFAKKIPLKEKIASVFTLGILFFSFDLNYLNYIWHGFHFPNDLPYRFSFMYCFLLLVLAYKAFLNLKEYTGRQILGTGVALIFAVIMIQEIGSKNVQDISVLLSVIFTVTYCLVFYLLRDEKRQRSATAVILLCCVIAEIACADTDRFSMSQKKGTFTDDYSSFCEVKKELDSFEDGDFYRMELTYNRARMDPAWFGYNGISTFSSMAYEKMSNMQSNLGLYSNFINSYTYYLQTPVYNMMNSLKYIVNNDSNVSVADDYYKEVASAGKFTAYSNKYYLPIGMAVNNEVKDWYSGYSNPFTVQSDWFESATGVSDVFGMMNIDDFRYFNIDEITSGLDTGDLYFTKTNDGSSGELTAIISSPEKKHCYLFVDSTTFEEITITKDETSVVQDTDEPYIYDLGVLEPEQYVEVLMTIENDDYGYINFYPYYVNEDALNEGYEILKNRQMTVESFEETRIKGTVKADEDCVFFTSIPYDKGWKVRIDGKEIAEDKYISLQDAYLCFELPAGEHEIELSFTQRGLLIGAGISVLAALALIAAYLFFKKKKPEFEANYRRKCEKAQADYEEMKAEEERARLAALMPEPEEIPLEDMYEEDGAFADGTFADDTSEDDTSDEVIADENESPDEETAAGEALAENEETAEEVETSEAEEAE